jgi:hypothetical protein
MSSYFFKIHILVGARKVVTGAFTNVSECHEYTNRVQCVITYEYKKLNLVFITTRVPTDQQISQGSHVGYCKNTVF